jgi:23S rRNA (guanosine2251-2'-O)-methyltransferase
MPPRKPFRPDKNQDLGRFPHGSRAGKSSAKSTEKALGKSPARDNRTQERPKPWAKDRPPERPRREDRPRLQKDALKSAGSGEGFEQSKSRNEAAENYKASGGSYWIYGNHAVLAAIDNPKRKIRRLLQANPDAEKAARGGTDRPLPNWEKVDRAILDRVAGRESVHQGIAAQVDPLPEAEVEDIAALAADQPEAKIVILDQVTDPHNVGAILRSAAAFGALAVVLTERNAAPESGVLAKAASGALEIVPLVRVTNLARAMEQLKAAGFWCAGLAAEAERTLAEARLSGRVALCLGAEGPGLRRLTRNHCDLLVKLPTTGPIGHLNVSNAAAVALYELSRAG